MSRPSKDVTQMLVDWSRGNQEVLPVLTPLVYEELRRVARHFFRAERPNHTLQPTALVHEAYLRLVDQKDGRLQGRAHFFSIAAEAMRRILVEHARRHNAAKRGGARKISLDETMDWSKEEAIDIVALDDALKGLAVLDPQKERIVELRFFSGLTIEETAHVLGVSTATIERGWQIAKLYLQRELVKGARHDA